MSSPLLDERSKAVLLAVIDKYIETAEPVGSRTVAKIYPEHLSSATLRNVMAGFMWITFCVRKVF